MCVWSVLVNNSVISKYVYFSFLLFPPLHVYSRIYIYANETNETTNKYKKKSSYVMAKWRIEMNWKNNHQQPKTAPVLGNFTEEEVNGSTLPQDTLEYPLQRDEVQTHHTKGERNNHQVPQSKLLFCCFITYFCALYVFVVVFIFYFYFYFVSLLLCFSAHSLLFLIFLTTQTCELEV